MRLFDNLSINKKILIPPILVLLFMLLISVVSASALISQMSLANKLYNFYFKNSNNASDIIKSVIRINENLYRIISWNSYNFYSTDKISELGNQQKTEIDSVVTNLKNILSSDLFLPEEKNVYSNTFILFAKYKEDALTVIDMITVDPAMSTMYMNKADKTYQLLSSNLTEIQNTEDRLSKNAYNNINAKSVSGIVTFCAIIILSIFISLILSMIISRTIIKAIMEFTSKSKEISDGNLNISIRSSGQDELGKLAESYNSFLEKLNSSMTVLNQISGINEDIAEKLHSNAHNLSLHCEMQATSSAEISSAMEEFNRTLDHISENIKKQFNTIDTSAQAIRELYNGIKEIIGRIETMKKSLTDNIDTANHGKNIIRESAEDTVKMNDYIGLITIKIKDVDIHTESVDNVLKVINNISEQTNILAMNAAIEAAHAGDSGKGFAIVAAEIRTLSESISSSISSIAEILKNIKRSVTEVVDISKNIEHSSMESKNKAVSCDSAIQTILTNISQINQEIDSISAITNHHGARTNEALQSAEELKKFSLSIKDGIEEQSKGSSLIMGAMNHVIQTISENTNMSENLEALSLNMKTQSGEILQQVSNYRLRNGNR